MSREQVIKLVSILGVALLVISWASPKKEAGWLGLLKRAENRMELIQKHEDRIEALREARQQRLANKTKELSVASKVRNRIGRQFQANFSVLRDFHRLAQQQPASRRVTEMLPFIAKKVLDNRRQDLKFVSSAKTLEREVNRIRIERIKTMLHGALLAAEEEALWAGKRHIVGRMDEYADDLEQEWQRAREALGERIATLQKGQPDEPKKREIGDFHKLKGTLSRPIQSEPDIGYGRRKQQHSYTYVRHTGLTWKVEDGTEVGSIGPGRVADVGHMKGYGRIAIVSHGKRYHSIYAHLQEVLVEEGQRIEDGDVIGLSGESGSFSGAKLYFELREHGHPVNPTDWFVRK